MPRTTRAVEASPADAPPLSAEHFEWLKELSVAVHRRAAYPPGHPTRVAGTHGAQRAIERALEGRPQITVIVTRTTLSVEDGVSDPGHPVLSDLADRLHRAQVAAVTLFAGLSDDEVDGLLAVMMPARASVSFTVAELPAEPDTEPISEPTTAPSFEPTRPLIGPHVRVDWLRFDALALGTDEDDADGDPLEGNRLWQALAAAVMLGEGDSTLDARTADPTRILDALRGVGDDPAQAKAATGALLDVARHVRRRGRSDGPVAARLRATMAQTSVETFEKLLRAHSDPEERRRIILQGIEVLPVSAVLDWLQAAARSSDHALSHHLLRLLGKMSRQTHRRSDRRSDEGGEALRQAARALVEGWSLGESAPAEHTALLEHIAAYEGGSRRGTGSAVASAERLVQMALELDAVGPDVLAALETLVEGTRLGVVVDLLERAPHAPGAVAEIEQALVAPSLLRRMLLSDRVAPEVVRACLARCGPGEVEPLLDVLALSEAQGTRLLVIGTLCALGERVRPAVLARLGDAGPYLLRNLLNVLAQLPEPPTGISLRGYLTHDEPIVRAEALRLLIRLPAERESALAAGFADRDVRVQRTAIELAAGGGIGREVLPHLLALLQQADDDGDLRLRGIPLLAQLPTPAARDWLLGLVLVRRGAFFWRRWALTARRPQVLAAVRALAHGWRTDPNARSALDLADASPDAAIREAVRRGGTA
ncbi:MAG: hypothetical protein FJ363_10545 [Gemmatimonadetes bacterium]|nr:hypothetical protein [Gemmatimonadota bacterium]